MNRFALLALFLAVVNCGGREKTEAAKPEVPRYTQELHHASPAAGAVVVERSGEFNLINSAIAAIDGTAEVAWWTPPGDPKQWFTLRMAGDVKISAVDLVRHGVAQTASSVMLEASGDGLAWKELGTVQLRENELITRFEAGGVTAQLLRVSILEGREHGFTALPELEVEGELVRPGGSVHWDGQWRVNQRLLSLRSSDGILFGEVPFLRTTMTLFGRPRGGFLPFAWSQGNVVGYGALSLSAHGEMNGLWYWEFPFTWRLAETWFGRREAVEAEPQVDRRAIALDFLREGHPSPFFEIAFEGSELASDAATESGLVLLRSIIESNPGARFRIGIWDTIGADLAAARIESLESALRERGPLPGNVIFAVKAGNLLDQPPGNPVAHALFERVDLEAAPAEAGSAAPIVLR